MQPSHVLPPLKTLYYLLLFRRVWNIGAIHGLLWITPKYLVEGTLGDGVYAVRTKGGFNAFFRKMQELGDFDIMYNHKVTVGFAKTSQG